MGTHVGQTSGNCAHEEGADTLMGKLRRQLDGCDKASSCTSSQPSRPPRPPTATLQKEHGYWPRHLKYGAGAGTSSVGTWTNEVCTQKCGINGLSLAHILQIGFLLLLALAEPSQAVFVGFKDCLSPSVINSEPKRLQFTPLFVWASFSTSASHSLNVTVYGNVSGQTTQESLPNPLNPIWNDSKSILGKIVDIPPDQNVKPPLATTLTGAFHVLDYTPYVIDATRFCNETVHGQCPIGPVFSNIS